MRRDARKRQRWDVAAAVARVVASNLCRRVQENHNSSEFHESAGGSGMKNCVSSN